MRQVYLDHNSTTPLHPEALEEMLPYLKERFGNPLSSHVKGEEAKRGVEAARAAIARALRAEPVDIVFTSSGTESNNLALKGFLFKCKVKNPHFITTKIEHHAILSTAEFLKGVGFDVTFVGVGREGVVDLSDIKKAVKKNTVLISVIHANNETGMIQPVSQIGKFARAKGIGFHTDAVQSFGKMPFAAAPFGDASLRFADDISADMISLSAHKIYGPKGAGALFIKKGVGLAPHMHGGYHERGLRAGTHNVAGIVGFGKAAELAMRNFGANDRIRKLKERLYAALKGNIRGVKLNGALQGSLPNTLNVSFDGLDSQKLLFKMNARGIMASMAASCTTGSFAPSHVLKAMGLSDECALSAVRFSLGIKNTEAEIDYCVKVIKGIICT